MEDQQAISAKIEHARQVEKAEHARQVEKAEHARQVEKALHWLGWLVAAVGVAGMAVFAGFWAAGDLNAEQGVSLVLGTTLATVLSGATAYGAGVNIGLGAERLMLAAQAASISPPLQDQPAADRLTGGSPELAGAEVAQDGGQDVRGDAVVGPGERMPPGVRQQLGQGVHRAVLPGRAVLAVHDQGRHGDLGGPGGGQRVATLLVGHDGGVVGRGVHDCFQAGPRRALPASARLPRRAAGWFLVIQYSTASPRRPAADSSVIRSARSAGGR